MTKNKNNKAIWKTRIKKDSSALFQKVEVRQEAEVRAAIESAVDKWGRLDCMFNNAGFGGVLGPIDEIPADEFDAAMIKLASEYEDMSISQLPAYAINRLYNRCVSCHSLDGTSGTGPSFKGLWDRVKDGNVKFSNGESLSSLLGDATLYGEPENYIRESLLYPQKHIVKGYLGSMPSFQGQLKEKQILAMIEMFKHLDEVTDEQGNITVNTDGTPVE